MVAVMLVTCYVDDFKRSPTHFVSNIDVLETSTANADVAEPRQRRFLVSHENLSNRFHRCWRRNVLVTTAGHQHRCENPMT